MATGDVVSPAKVRLGPSPRRNRKVYPHEGTIDYQGLKILVENRRGSTRSGVGHGGKRWSTVMRHHYGEIVGTEGADGDRLDVYVGPLRFAPLVVVVHQQDPRTRQYDEDKVMLGFATVEEALREYRAHYDRPGFYQSHTAMTIGEFREWCADRRRRGDRVKRVMKAAQLLAILKGATHKYIKRVPFTDKNGRKRYRYYYHAAHGRGGVHAIDDFKIGAAFAYKDGHYHVVGIRGGKVKIRHDESGEERELDKGQLATLLRQHHAESIDAHKSRLMEEIKAAGDHGTPQQVARLVAQARRSGYITEEQAGKLLHFYAIKAAKRMLPPGADPGVTSLPHGSEDAKTLDDYVLSQESSQEYLADKLGTTKKRALEILKDTRSAALHVMREKGGYRRPTYRYDELALDALAMVHTPDKAAEFQGVAGASPLDPGDIEKTPSNNKGHDDVIALSERGRNRAYGDAMGLSPELAGSLLALQREEEDVGVDFNNKYGADREHLSDFAAVHGPNVRQLMTEGFVRSTGTTYRVSDKGREALKRGQREAIKRLIAARSLSGGVAAPPAPPEAPQPQGGENPAHERAARKFLGAFDDIAERTDSPDLKAAVTGGPLTGAALRAIAVEAENRYTLANDALASLPRGDEDAPTYRRERQAAIAAMKQLGHLVIETPEGHSPSVIETLRKYAKTPTSAAARTQKPAPPPKVPEPAAPKPKASPAAAGEDVRRAYGFTDDEFAKVRYSAAKIQESFGVTSAEAFERAAAGHAKRLGKTRREPRDAPSEGDRPAPRPPVAAQPTSEAGPRAPATDVRQAAAAAVKAASKAAPIVHERIGEHVGGARRDTAVSTGPRGPKRVPARKDKLFGDFNIHEHVAAGGTVAAWHVKQAIHAAVGAKAPEGREDEYREAVSLVARTLDRVKTVDDARMAVDELQQWMFHVVNPGDPVPGGGGRPKWSAYTNTLGGRRHYYERDGRDVLLGRRFESMILNHSSSGSGPFSKAVRVAQQLPEDVEAYVQAQAGRQAARKRGKPLTMRQMKVSGETDTDDAQRVGGRHLPTQVHGEDVAAVFGGLRNIDYGQPGWMDQDSRQYHLSSFHGAMHDLADVLGVSPAKISLGGRLAVAFGARGKGNAVAHYEPAREVLNITKFRGNGSLAHEWGHFLDNVAAKVNNVDGSTDPKRRQKMGAGKLHESDRYVSDSTYGLPPATRAAVVALRKAVEGSEFRRHAEALDDAKKRSYWATPHEMFARLFESWVEDTLSSRGQRSTYLVKNTAKHYDTDVSVASAPKYDRSHPDVVAARAEVEAADEHYRQTIRAEAAIHTPRASLDAATWTGLSEASENALRYKSPKTMKASKRRWEAALAHKKALRAAREDVPAVVAQPYPQGAEREQLGALMADVLQAFKSDGIL